MRFFTPWMPEPYFASKLHNFSCPSLAFCALVHYNEAGCTIPPAFGNEQRISREENRV